MNRAQNKISFPQSSGPLLLTISDLRGLPLGTLIRHKKNKQYVYLKISFTEWFSLTISMLLPDLNLILDDLEVLDEPVTITPTPVEMPVVGLGLGGGWTGVGTTSPKPRTAMGQTNSQTIPCKPNETVTNWSQSGKQEANSDNSLSQQYEQQAASKLKTDATISGPTPLPVPTVSLFDSPNSNYAEMRMEPSYYLGIREKK